MEVVALEVALTVRMENMSTLALETNVCTVVHLHSVVVLIAHQENTSMNQVMVNVVFVALRLTEVVLIVHLVNMSIRIFIG